MINRHYSSTPGLREFVCGMPKAESHLHLEGSVTYGQLHDFDPERYAHEPEFWDPGFRFGSFDEFQSAFAHWIMPYHSSIERYRETARNVFARCAEQGCRYVETSFHLPTLHYMQREGPELLEAIVGEVPDGLEVRVFGAMSHVDYAPHVAIMESALTWDLLAGIDLHGPEVLPVDEGIPDYWRRAKAAGKITKAHAGEFLGWEFVQWAIDHLEVDRIQHGVRAIESPALVEVLAERGTVLDVCPISNVKLAVDGVDSMAVHPIRKLFDAGVNVTVNTDDTFMFGNTLVEEYYALHQELGFTPEEDEAACGQRHQRIPDGR